MVNIVKKKIKTCKIWFSNIFLYKDYVKQFELIVCTLKINVEIHSAYLYVNIHVTVTLIKLYCQYIIIWIIYIIE